MGCANVSFVPQITMGGRICKKIQPLRMFRIIGGNSLQFPRIKELTHDCVDEDMFLGAPGDAQVTFCAPNFRWEPHLHCAEFTEKHKEVRGKLAKTLSFFSLKTPTNFHYFTEISLTVASGWISKTFVEEICTFLGN